MSEKSYGKRVEVLVDSISKGHRRLQEGAPGVSTTRLWLRTSRRVYTTVVEDAKREILV